jgi:hypothetical protein
MLNGLVTTLLILALGFLGYDASLRTRVVKERAAVSTPTTNTEDSHAREGGDGPPIKP